MDLIDRQAAVDALWKALYKYEDETEKQFQTSEDLDVGDWIEHRIFVQNMNDIDRQTILNLPSAQAKPEQNTRSEQRENDKLGVKMGETCTDTISRQAAIKAVSDACFELRGVFGRCEDALKALPTVEERKKGKWLSDIDDAPVLLMVDGCPVKSCYCSECGEWLTASDEYYVKGNFCPNCGADMRGEA